MAHHNIQTCYNIHKWETNRKFYDIQWLLKILNNLVLVLDIQNDFDRFCVLLNI